MDVADGSMGIDAWEEGVVLGLDPGRDKTGFAFVGMKGELLLSGMFDSRDAERFFEALRDYGYISGFVIESGAERVPCELLSHVRFIALGNGTTSRDFHEMLRTRLDREVLIVDERNTTLEARSLYWRIHKPGFLMRLLPEGMRVPGRVLDDLAAWSIALRALKKYRDISVDRL